jgi:hypothetical protein
MKYALTILCLTLALGACRSADKSYSDAPCTCGTPEARFGGCAHPACMSGEGNPDNPDCVCGGIEIE